MLSQIPQIIRQSLGVSAEADQIRCFSTLTNTVALDLNVAFFASLSSSPGDGTPLSSGPPPPEPPLEPSSKTLRIVGWVTTVAATIAGPGLLGVGIANASRSVILDGLLCLGLAAAIILSGQLRSIPHR